MMNVFDHTGHLKPVYPFIGVRFYKKNDENIKMTNQKDRN